MNNAATVVTPDEMLRRGLIAVGFAQDRIRKVARATNLKRFRAHFGSNPIVYAYMWEDLLSTTNPDARIDAATANLDAFLMCLHFLKCYPSEAVLAATFFMCEKTVRKWRCFFSTKIQALKTDKVLANFSVVSSCHCCSPNACYICVYATDCVAYAMDARTS
jgi:hypothetical protein